MNRTWLYTTLLMSLTLLSLLKTHEYRSLKTFYKHQKTLRLDAFDKARSKVTKEDLDILKLWESILTGRSAPVSRLLKERYEKLGLNHIFTPSGFHLSAVLFPFLKVLRNNHYQFLFLLIVGISLMTLPGLMALKRMVLIKTNQKLMGLKSGFILGLCLDMLFGSFQNGALSFTYSFLFLSIIYSGLEGISLIIWFFIGQLILAYFQNADISPLVLVFSPLINLGFGFIMPILFLLAIPLWDWQLHLGIFLLKGLQSLVNLFSEATLSFPLIEVHTVTMLMLLLLIMRKSRFLLLAILLNSNGLNLDRERSPALSNREFVPRGEISKTRYREKDVLVYFEDGKCKMRLVRGLWWENCSPVRRSR